MALIRDSLGKSWEVSMVGAAFRKIREATGFNLFELYFGQPPLAVRLQMDDSLPLEMAYAAIAASSLEVAKIEHVDQFLARFAPDAMTEAAGRVRKEIEDFFRKGGRTNEADYLRAAEREWKQRVALAAAKLAPTTNESATSSPASSESTPTDTPSAG